MTSAMRTAQRPSAVGYRLEVPDKPNGPAVTFLVKRSAVIGGVLAGIALGALKRSRTPAGRAASLGALAPGAGYVYTRSPLRAAGAVTAFGASLVTWFGSGNVLAPPAVWAAATFDARRQAKNGRKTWDAATTVVPLALGGATVAGVIARRKAFRAAQARGHLRAEYLATTPRIEITPRTTDPSELSQADLATIRALCDRGLQPRDRFDGYDMIEQFQGSSVRYQLFWQQWALALAQLYHTPAFHGYLSAAQRNIIEKFTTTKVWGYWRWESTWGNLSLNWDPMVRDNIMLSGWLGTSIGAYQANTGDDRYSKPGALVFRSGRREWPYDLGKIAEAVYQNMKRSRMTLFSCEPNWVYNMCNMTGINTLLLTDRILGTDYNARIGAEFSRAMNAEFIAPDGRSTAIRSARLGITIPMLTSITADCSVVPMQHPSDPELAGRTWAIVRKEFVDTSGRDPELVARGWDYLDYGNYKPGKFLAKAELLWTAAEMGDSALYDAQKASIDRDFPPTIQDGALWYPGGSALANFGLAMARFSPPGAYRGLVNNGPGQAVLTGPYLEDANYPEVLVARATTDGDDLRLVLRPGTAPGRQRLGINRLVAGRRYDLKGAIQPDVTASADGSARFDVDLAGRTEVVLTPAV
jgi:hypothetical protein